MTPRPKRRFPASIRSPGTSMCTSTRSRRQTLDPLRAEFIKYILSKDGQEQTEKGGFYPITNEIRESELTKLGISTAP